jgi:hypothetical protein
MMFGELQDLRSTDPHELNVSSDLDENRCYCVDFREENILLLKF